MFNKNFLYYLEEIKETSDFEIINYLKHNKLTEEEGIEKLNNFLKKQSPNIANLYDNILIKGSTSDEDLKIILKDLPAKEGRKLSPSIKYNKITSKIFFNELANQMGRGELLIGWIYNSILTSNQNYDTKINGTAVEIKSPDESSGNVFRFGMSRDTVIQSYIIEDTNEKRQISFWNEITHTVNKVVKIADKLKEYDPEIATIVDKIVGRKTSIINTVNFSDADRDNFIKFYTKCNEYLHDNEKIIPKNDEEEGNQTFSRIGLRGRYIKKKDIIVEPITKKEVDAAEQTGKKISVKVVKPEEHNDAILLGRLFDLFYVRHPKAFINHMEGIKNFILNDKKYYFFFNNDGTIFTSGMGNSIRENFKFHSITTSRIKLQRR